MSWRPRARSHNLHGAFGHSGDKVSPATSPTADAGCDIGHMWVEWSVEAVLPVWASHCVSRHPDLCAPQETLMFMPLLPHSLLRTPAAAGMRWPNVAATSGRGARLTTLPARRPSCHPEPLAPRRSASPCASSARSVAYLSGR